MVKNNKIGILKYVAKTGAKGVKFEDDPETWYNPTNDAAKEMVKEEYIGKEVEVILVEGQKTKFTSMVLLEGPQGEAEVDEEKVSDEELEQMEKEVNEEVEEEQEKVPQTPPKEEEEDPAQDDKESEEAEESPLEKTGAPRQLMDMLKGMKAEIDKREYDQATYAEMEKTKLETAKKGPMKLTYASWAEVWGALKRIHPTAQFEVHENKEGVPVFYNKDLPGMGGFVKVTATVKGLSHTVHLPVMDHSNKSMAVGTMTTFDINKNIQRALAKAIALHGMGLYVFKGEDYPVDAVQKK